MPPHRLDYESRERPKRYSLSQIRLRMRVRSVLLKVSLYCCLYLLLAIEGVNMTRFEFPGLLKTTSLASAGAGLFAAISAQLIGPRMWRSRSTAPWMVLSALLTIVWIF